MNSSNHKQRIEQALKRALDMPRHMGKAEYVKHLRGERLTRNEAIKAKCFDCVGGEDTRTCKIIKCSLTQYSPWNSIDDKEEAGA